MVAAGYGSLRADRDGRPIPKVVENINGLPIISRSLRMAELAGISDTIVVANPRDHASVVAAIDHSVRAGSVQRMPEIVMQPERRGSADAVRQAIPNLRRRNIDHALITYADMPMWSSESACRLCATHQSSHFVTMATVRRSIDFPVLDRYGRVIRNRGGEIIGVIEYNSPYISPKAYAIQSVNPSFWIWNLEWLTQAIPKIPPFKKSDGFGDELHMPPLIHMTRIAGRYIHECALPPSVSHEALGVNTLEELHSLTRHLSR